METSSLVGIIADTHDNRRAIEKAVALFNRRGVGKVFHAGDSVSPFTALDFSRLTCSMVTVFGNNDGERIGLLKTFSPLGTITAGPHQCEYGGRRFVLMHEPACMEALTAGGGVDVIIYGHTHEIDVRTGGTLIINPGEGGGWLSGRATAAILDLAAMKVEIEEIG
jgi:putative phosphoesterase